MPGHPKGRKSSVKPDKKRGAAKQAFKKKNAKARHEDLREKLDRTVREEEIVHKIHGITDLPMPQSISQSNSNVDGSLTDIMAVLQNL